MGLRYKGSIRNYRQQVETGMTKKEFYSHHKACPKCGEKGDKLKRSKVEIPDSNNFFDDINTVACKGCGWFGKANNLK